jgi:hypothetical protein
MKKVKGAALAWRVLALLGTGIVAGFLLATDYYSSLTETVGGAVIVVILIRSMRLGLWVGDGALVARSWLRTRRFEVPFTLTPAVYDGAILGDSIWRSRHLRMIRVVRGREQSDLRFTLSSGAAIYRQVQEIETALGIPSRARDGRRRSS